MACLPEYLKTWLRLKSGTESSPSGDLTLPNGGTHLAGILSRRPL